MSVAYLESLNREQRRAVEHGASENNAAPGPPLLVIAGARQVIGNSAGTVTDALTWAGTFHGIGARLLREYADRIGLDPAFTIHDREDSADLMNLVRYELGFSA